MADLTTSLSPNSTTFGYNATNASSFMTSQGEQTTATTTTPFVPVATTTVAPPPAVITQAIVAITTNILQTTAGMVVTAATTSTSSAGLTTTQLVIVILGSLAAIPALIALLCVFRACIKCCINRNKVQPEMIPVGQRRDDEDVGYLYQTKPGFANGRAPLSKNMMTTAQNDPSPRPIVVPPYVANIRPPQPE